ncbi:MAG: hypothetical protein PVI40_06795 [Chlamydiota bacterium]|jgi:hypothetical protein
MTPREERLLRQLADKDKIFVKDLRALIGALNPAQIASNLRKQGWKIHTDYITMYDRDRNLCRPGYYWMDASERDRACTFLIKVEGAAGTAPSTDDNLELQNLKSSDNNDDNIIGGENDNLLS